MYIEYLQYTVLYNSQTLYTRDMHITVPTCETSGYRLINQSVYPSIHLSIYPSIYPSIHLSIDRPIRSQDQEIKRGCAETPAGMQACMADGRWQMADGRVTSRRPDKS
jgi:hypothetical protein